MANPSLIITASDQASPAIARVRGQLDELMRSFGGFGKLSSQLSVPLLGVSTAIVGIGAAVANALNVTKWVDDLADSGSALGISAENMAKYQILAKQAGLESEALGSALQTLAKNVAGAKEGQAAQVELFRRLGISVKELKQLSPDETIRRVAQSFTELKGGLDKAALSYEAYGKAGKRINDVNDNLASGMEVNTGLTKELEAQFLKFDKTLAALEITWKRFSVTLAGPVVNAILAVADALNLLPKTPLEELGNQIERLQKRISEEGTIKGALKYWPMSKEEFAEKNAQLKELQDRATAMFRAGERAQFGGGPGSKEVPEAIDTSKIAASAARFQKESEDIKKKELEMALQIQRANEAATQKVEDANQRRLEREFEAQKEFNEKMVKLFAEVDEAERAAIEKGGEIIAERRAKQIEEVEDRIGSITRLTESFFLKLTSFKGQDIFKTLAKDLAQSAYRMLILEPMLERMRKQLEDMADSVEFGGKGEGFTGILMKLFGLVGTGETGAVQLSGPKALGGPVGFAQAVGEAGPEIFLPRQAGTIVPNSRVAGLGAVTINQSYNIDSRSDIGTISAMLEMNRTRTLRDVREQLSRRSPNLRV